MNFFEGFMRSVVGTHMFAFPWMKGSAENVSLKINKSRTDLFNCTDETTSQQLAAQKKAVATELKNTGKDLFETTKTRKVTVTDWGIHYPDLVAA